MYRRDSTNLNISTYAEETQEEQESMCNLGTHHACGHTSYRKVSCRAKKVRQQSCCVFAFVAALKCIDKSSQMSYEMCSHCMRLQGWRQGEEASQGQAQMHLMRRRASLTYEELTIEVAMLASHFNTSSCAAQRESIINPGVRPVVTIKPETSRWVDTIRYRRGDGEASPISSGWANSAEVSPISSSK